jgi:NitT/TauT family transport system ATP-binding protein
VLLVTHDIDESVYLGDRVLVLTSSPATLVADLPVGLPARRHQITTRESEEFVRLRAEVARLLQAGGPAGRPDAEAAERWLRSEAQEAAEQRHTTTSN